jgi:ABC-type lipoprotein export system ATPase subunit
MSVTAVRTQLATCSNVSVEYGAGDARVVALEKVDLQIGSGESVALQGASGSGKTTLLHVLGGLVSPTSGTVEWRGRSLSSLDAAARGRARASGIAYVFQGANLLPHFTALENVAFAARAAGADGSDRWISPLELLELVGLAGKRDALPAELSGGEAQRVAIARALAQSPQLLLCDEPTGQLDSDTGERVLRLIEALYGELHFAIVCATHDTSVAARFERVVALADGRLAGEERP